MTDVVIMIALAALAVTLFSGLLLSQRWLSSFVQLILVALPACAFAYYFWYDWFEADPLDDADRFGKAAMFFYSLGASTLSTLAWVLTRPRA
ncbi:hypothetical protein HK107_06320 [Parvularcula sp. ZS-1/3]|uniref:Uncharacterized protein n=1 Tax=Parvularcula mediterranea TaxID=2732508 RepID=A0A7Y3W555_9PROT|nr:hypothetical protein [Parvularcula mediterranea]NNU15937.1 hypothetical protein [Parvularcula mediterranea]